MFCKNCGQELDEGTNFCTKCGNKLSVSNKKQIILPIISILVSILLSWYFFQVIDYIQQYRNWMGSSFVDIDYVHVTILIFIFSSVIMFIMLLQNKQKTKLLLVSGLIPCILYFISGIYCFILFNRLR
jgi:predicted nucleic acid-binding Zn ribbon protein